MATVDLPDELARRLQAKAARRKMRVNDVAAELLAANLPDEDALEAFLGGGRSGRTEPLDIHAERAAEAERRLAQGA